MSDSPSHRLPLISRLLRPLAQAVQDLMAGINQLIQRPFRDVRRALPGRTVTRDSRGGHGGWRWLPVWLLLAAGGLILKILLSPLELTVAVIQRRSRAALLSLVLVVVLLGSGRAAQRIADRSQRVNVLRMEAGRAARENDYPTVIDHHRQLMKLNAPVSQQEQFELARALLHEDRLEEGAQILNRLAPNDPERAGFPPAHRHKAIEIALGLQSKYDARLIDQLKNHLDRCSDLDPDDADLQRARAEYLMAIGDPTRAISALQAAAKHQPELLVLVADAYRKSGNRTQYRDALEEARDALTGLLDSQPDNDQHRIMLARVWVELQDPQRAEAILLEGAGHFPSDALQRARASFYLARYRSLERLARSGNPGGGTAEAITQQQLESLQASLAHDPSHLKTYEALIRFYRSTDHQPAATAVLDTLHQLIATGAAPGLAHFALSNLLWIDGQPQQARQQMELAYQQAPAEMAVVANNLAWILAELNPPELDHAHDLARQVVDRFPDDGRLRDTLANILLKRKNYEQAVLEFKKALPAVTDKAAAHEKIAQCYQHLGRLQLAQQHRQRARLGTESDRRRSP